MSIPIKSFAHKKMSLHKTAESVKKEAQIIKRFDMAIIKQFGSKRKKRKG